jgi:hypothetical protein
VITLGGSKAMLPMFCSLVKPITRNVYVKSEFFSTVKRKMAASSTQPDRTMWVVLGFVAIVALVNLLLLFLSPHITEIENKKTYFVRERVSATGNAVATSSNSNALYFANIALNGGKAMTTKGDATDGSYVEIHEPGVYTFTTRAKFSTAQDIGFFHNPASLNPDFTMDDSVGFLIGVTDPVTLTITVKCEANDKMYVMALSAPQSAELEVIRVA